MEVLSALEIPMKEKSRPGFAPSTPAGESGTVLNPDERADFGGLSFMVVVLLNRSVRMGDVSGPCDPGYCINWGFSDTELGISATVGPDLSLNGISKSRIVESKLMLMSK